MNVEVDLFKLNDFFDACEISYQLGTKEPQCVLETKQKKMDMNAYQSIWYRRPGNIRAPSFIEPWIGRMVENEARSAMDGVFRSLTCTWVNYPPANSACTDKLWQLQKAQKVELKIPETLVTNKPQLVREFYESCDGNVIYKLIGELSNQAVPNNETPRGIPTLTLRKEDLPFLHQVEYAPHLFQRRIKKAFDLRVTIVGEELFCTRIHSQEGIGKVDWRHDYTVLMDEFELPHEIAKKCFALTKSLDLNYGAIDLVLTDDEDYIFLEINCGGQYLWVEQTTKQPISRSIARLLIGDLAPLIRVPITA